MKRYNILCIYIDSERLEEVIKAIEKLVGRKNVFIDTNTNPTEISVVCSKDDWERIKALSDCWKNYVI